MFLSVNGKSKTKKPETEFCKKYKVDSNFIYVYI